MQYLSFPKKYRVQNMQKFADQLDNVIQSLHRQHIGGLERTVALRFVFALRWDTLKSLASERVLM